MRIHISKSESIKINDFKTFLRIKNSFRPQGKKSKYFFWIQIIIAYCMSFFQKDTELGNIKVKIFKKKREFNIKFCDHKNQYVITCTDWNIDHLYIGREMIPGDFKTSFVDTRVSPIVMKIDGEIGFEFLTQRVVRENFDKQKYFTLIRILQNRSKKTSSYKSILAKSLDNAIFKDLVYETLNDPTLNSLLHKVKLFGLTHGDAAIWNLYEKNGAYLLIDWEFSRSATSTIFDVIYFCLADEVLFNKNYNPNIILDKIIIFCGEYLNIDDVNEKNYQDMLYLELIIAHLILKKRHTPEDILSVKLKKVVNLARKKRLDNCYFSVLRN